MIFKELLEKLEDDEEVYAVLVVPEPEIHSFRNKIFIANASDFLADKIWLDKEVVKICSDQIEDYISRITVSLKD